MLGEGTPVPDCGRKSWRVLGRENSRIAAHDHTCKGPDVQGTRAGSWGVIPRTGLLGVPANAFAETPVFAPNGSEGVVTLRIAFGSQGLQLGRWRRRGVGRGNALGLL